MNVSESNRIDKGNREQVKSVIFAVVLVLYVIFDVCIVFESNRTRGDSIRI